MASSSQPSLSAPGSRNPYRSSFQESPTSITQPESPHNSPHSNEAGIPMEMRPMHADGSALEVRHAAPDHRRFSSRVEDGLHNFVNRVEYGLYMDPSGRSRRHSVWERLTGKNRKKVKWSTSANNTVRSSSTSVSRSPLHVF